MLHVPRQLFYNGYGLFGTEEEVHMHRDRREGWSCTFRLRRQTKQKRLGLAMFWVRMGKHPNNKKPAFPLTTIMVAVWKGRRYVLCLIRSELSGIRLQPSGL